MAERKSKKRKRTVSFEDVQPEPYDSDEDFGSDDCSTNPDSSLSTEFDIIDCETSDSEHGSLMDFEGNCDLVSSGGAKWENGAEYDPNHTTPTHYTPTHHAENVVHILGWFRVYSFILYSICPRLASSNNSRAPRLSFSSSKRAESHLKPGNQIWPMVIDITDSPKQFGGGQLLSIDAYAIQGISCRHKAVN